MINLGLNDKRISTHILTLSRHVQGDVTGRVTINGTELSPRMFRRLGTLVPQDDTLLPGLTVAQTLKYGAALRCRGSEGGRRATAAERESKVWFYSLQLFIVSLPSRAVCLSGLYSQGFEQQS